MKRLGLTILIFSLFIADLFATQAEFKMMKELEQTEKTSGSERIERPGASYKAGSLRDPFQKPFAEEGKPAGGKGEEEPKVSETVEKPFQPPPLTVQGLIWGGRFPQAIINNKVVKEGDTIEGAKVISIDKEGVSVLFEQRYYNLSSPAAAAGPSKNP